MATIFRARPMPRIFREWWVYFLIAFALVAAGFWPTLFAVLTTTDAGHLIHGLSATAWMSLPIFQAWLIKTRRRKLHRTIGWASPALALVVVLSGLYILQVMVRRTEDYLLNLKFLFMDLTGLALFCLFLGWAIWAALKRDLGLHLRLIGCTALIPLEAAMERLLIIAVPFLTPNFDTALYGSLIFMEFVLAVLIVGEVALRRLRWPFPFMAAYYAAMFVFATPVASSPYFQSFARSFAQLG
ncbi:MAG: DUF2306 domain-containing protein [Sphingomicrobium sp.]